MTVIAIDGPAGAGKSTVARAVARRLGLARLDTGAMYRAVTLLALRTGSDPGDAARVAELASGMVLSLDDDTVVLDGEDVTDAIRSPAVDAAVSTVAAIPAVRAELVRRQRDWVAERGGAVVEGRDIGSVVFPKAEVKVYLDAHPEERARRRSTQLGLEEEGDGLVSTAARLSARDSLDAGRAVSPLAVAEGAIVVDSTHLSVDDVVEEVLRCL